jgi:hypothetical protein
VSFELVSDQASLRYLFQQKTSLALILRLCEFLAEFDFQEVQVVKGTDNAVPDFLSRPWDADSPDVGLYALSHPHMEKASTLSALIVQDHPHIVLLTVCNDDNIAEFHDGRDFSLPLAAPTAQETRELSVRRLVKAIGGIEGSMLMMMSFICSCRNKK